MQAPSRHLLLANPACFVNRGQHGGILFAELAAGEDRRHGVVFQADAKRLACSCDFQPKPCVHARAFEVLCQQAGAEVFAPTEQLPDWVNAVLGGQRVRVSSKASPEPDRAAAKQARRFDRLERAARGFEDLEQWLHDTVRRGLATAVAEDPAVFAGIAARLADAKLTALSRQFRLVGERVGEGPGWEETATAAVADAYFVLRAFERRDALAEALLYDLQTAIGIALRKEEVLALGDPVTDIWAVLGQREETLENQLKQRRTWLYGGRTGRYALLLEHEFGGAFALGFTPGCVVQAAVAFYPGAWPLRVQLTGDATTVPKKVEKLPGYAALETALADYAAALGQQPWLGAWPLALQRVRPYRTAPGGFACADPAGQAIELDVAPHTGWQLLALSAGQPIGVFGEWQEGKLKVLGAVGEGRYVAL